MINISMWNLLYFLPFEHILPMINTTEASINTVLWIGPEYLRPNAVYVGHATSFFDTETTTTLVVNRRDMLLIKDTDPEDVFNEICQIMDRLQCWEQKLKDYLDMEDGLQKMLACSREIIGNPAYVYGPDGSILAITPDKKGTHWVWDEILEDNGLSPSRMRYLKDHIQLSEVFKDTYPTRRDSRMSDYTYIHCSLFANGYMAGHFVLFGMTQEIPRGFEAFLVNLIEYMNQFILRHFDSYSPSSRVETLARNILRDKNASPKTYQEILKAMYWESPKIFRLFLIAEKNGTFQSEQPVLLDRLNSHIRHVFPELLIFRIGNMLTIIEYNRSLTLHSTETTLLHLLEDSFLCGISCYYTEFHKSVLYYYQAREELLRCEQENTCCCIATQGTFSHLVSILKHDTTGICYTDLQLQNLLAYDTRQHTEYFTTLKNWCMCGCSLSETASRMHVHRNTITYRLEKIQEIFPLDLYRTIIKSGDQKQIDQLFYAFMVLSYHEN